MAEPEPGPEAAEPEASARAVPAAAAPPVREPISLPVDGVLDATALRRVWPEVLDTVKRSSRRTRALLDGAQVSDLDGDLVTLSIAAAPLARMLGEESNADVIKGALTQVIGGTWRLTVTVSGPVAAEADPADPAASAGSTAPAGPPAPPAPPAPKVEVPPPPVPRPAHERDNGESRAQPQQTQAESDPREDSDPESESEPGRQHDPEAEAVRLLQSTLGARPIED
jgi:DNA polymerase-3 subunit gamma/tau